MRVMSTFANGYFLVLVFLLLLLCSMIMELSIAIVSNELIIFQDKQIIAYFLLIFANIHPDLNDVFFSKIRKYHVSGSDRKDGMHHVRLVGCAKTHYCVDQSFRRECTIR